MVPPNQSEMMADALRRKGRPVAYLAFEGEQHGFRRADNIIRSLEAELAFYGAVFGFTPADSIAPVPIENAHRLPERLRRIQNSQFRMRNRTEAEGYDFCSLSARPAWSPTEP